MIRGTYKNFKLGDYKRSLKPVKSYRVWPRPTWDTNGHSVNSIAIISSLLIAGFDLKTYYLPNHLGVSQVPLNHYPRYFYGKAFNVVKDEMLKLHLVWGNGMRVGMEMVILCQCLLRGGNGMESKRIGGIQF